MSDAIVEIRDYTFDAETFAAYKVWAEELAVPLAESQLGCDRLLDRLRHRRGSERQTLRYPQTASPTLRGLFAGTALKTDKSDSRRPWRRRNGRRSGPNTPTSTAICI